MNSPARAAAVRESRIELLCNWLAVITLLALGIVLPGLDGVPGTPERTAADMTNCATLSR
jgi:hypothetical protein